MNEHGRTLGDVVRARRDELGISQEDLAERVGVTQEAISRIERGATETPRRKTLERLASVLRIPLADFYVATGIAATEREGRKVVAALPPSTETARERLLAKIDQIEWNEGRIRHAELFFDVWLRGDYVGESATPDNQSSNHSAHSTGTISP